ncbi:uncharacterized protein LOC105702478 isoform X1 [Orussus abietinus]|uniref:uncharacterized protein LOC105702478 isoform X1 n=1 Tax=Orussus abietinus TaxID=222816 RepID=UPI00062567E4|nr:uncharacterized protein LOC105702478 isoform X1 [Orussus abietinus]XP_012285494.1 uncharacterized protein LOC105702478 isoform X1 [Orussus abietinus]
MWTILASTLLAQVSADKELDDAIVEDEPSSGEAPDLPGLGQKLPTPAELLKMLDSMAGLSEEDKENIRSEILKNQQGQGHAKALSASSDFTTETALLLVLLGVIALVFVFFGYKLYRSLSERERKREEKKRNKQMKKKK